MHEIQEIKKDVVDIKEDIQLVFHALQHLRIGQNEILNAIGTYVSDEEVHALQSLNRRLKRSVNRFKALNALTPADSAIYNDQQEISP